MARVARKRLGEILVEMGALTDERLRAALSEQQRWGGRLGQILVQMRAVAEPALLAALSTQMNTPVAALDTVQLSAEATALIPRAVCEELGVLPFALRGNFLDLAMLDPTELDSIERIRVMSRKNVRPFLVGPLTYERALKRAYDAPIAGSTVGIPELEQMFGGEMLDVDPPPQAPPPPGPTLPPMAPARPIDVEPEVAPPPPFEVPHGFPVPPPPPSFVPPPRQPPPRPALAPLDLDDPPEPPTPAAETTPAEGYDLGELRESAPPEGVPAWAAAMAAQLAAAHGEIEGLAARLAQMEALLARDEAVLRKVLSLLVAGGVCTQEQLVLALRTAQES